MNTCPLTGQVCNKPVTFVITEHLGDKTQSTSCCRDCAISHIQHRNEVIIPEPTIFTAKELLDGLLTGSLFQSLPAKTCKGCGVSFSQILKTGRIGCPHCYTTFVEELKPYLDKTQAGDQHAGKAPLVPSLIGLPPDQQIKLLEKVMAEASLAEDYEKAARCRDMIKSIRQSSL